jgi:hypothetical protein
MRLISNNNASDGETPDVWAMDSQWLAHMNSSCEPAYPWDIGLSSSAHTYIRSVPQGNHQALRWGWKLPESSFRIDRYVKVFPKALFIHVVRNPLDMAASFLEHLPSHAREFSLLHENSMKAAELMTKRCAEISQKSTVPQNWSCAVGESQLSLMGNWSKCWGHPKNCLESSPEAWQCMEMMLWAELNSALSTFGANCLISENRYVVWHGEDGYGLRGNYRQQMLIRHLEGEL